MAIITSPENHKKLALQRDYPQARAGRGSDRRGGARARGGRQGGGLDRRRTARHRSPRRAAVDGDGLSAGEPHRRRDDAFPERHSSSWRCTLTRRHGARVAVGTCARTTREAVDDGTAPALSEVHRSRQQPRLLHVHPGRDHRTSTASCIREWLSANRLQPSSDRAGRDDHVRAAVPRSVQLQFRSAHAGQLDRSAPPCTADLPPRAKPA